ncbi:MAG TPA: GntR family transcriptional regulator, partial [Pseudonocardiaceae bacterium]
MTDSKTPKPVGYQHIAAWLRERIETDEFGPGAKIPSENELMASFNVEQPTARRALEVLKNEGLIYARRGAGTFVREFRPIRRVSPDRLRSEVWGSGRSIWSVDLHERPSARDVSVNEEQAPERIAHVLELPPGAAVWVRRRRYFVEDKPVQLAVSYYPANVVTGSPITAVNTGDGGAYARLTELGYEPVRFVEELRVRMPTSAERETLELTQGVPVADLTRTA